MNITTSWCYWNAGGGGCRGVSDEALDWAMNRRIRRKNRMLSQEENPARECSHRRHANRCSEDPRYVRVEIITGFDRDTISDVVEARNTSNQVRDESLANLRQEFEPLKEILKESSYADLIAWSEYEELESGKPKPIDVRDIISYLITFDTAAYNSTSQPLIAYKDKRACLRHFQENKARLQKLYPLLPDILALWDEIHLR
jgi:hypothetical protein